MVNAQPSAMVDAMSASIPELYARQDAMADPGMFAGLYEDLPADVSALRDVASQLILHVSWAERYGIPPDVPLPRDTQSVSDRLKLIQKGFAGSLAAERPPHKRTFGTCRDYSLMLCSMLRRRSIAARIRCGFATYFSSGLYEDHWICEYWSTERRGWVRVDAQLDRLQQAQLAIKFDCADLPSKAYLTSGQAWTLARSGAAEPNDFGHGDSRGSWFLRVNVHRDLLALTNQHISAWDTWRNSTAPSKVLSVADKDSCDRLARTIEAAEQSAVGITALAALAAQIRVPPWQH
jgi:Transglutaminase-like superfamily